MPTMTCCSTDKLKLFSWPTKCEYLISVDTYTKHLKVISLANFKKGVSYTFFKLVYLF